MQIVPAQPRRRGGTTQAVLNTIAGMAGAAVNKQVGKVVEKVVERAMKPRPAPPPATKKTKRNNKALVSTTGAPTSFGSFSSNSLGRNQIVRSTANSSIVRGSTVLGPVTLTSGYNVGRPVCAYYASSNPITFSDRMQTLASTYDKYVYHRATLRYIPNVGSSSVGQVAITIDRDYLDPPQTAGYSQTLSYEAQAFGSVWLQHSCSINRDSHEKRAYFTNFAADNDLRESEQFKFYAFLLGASSSNAPYGYLVLDYEIELISPVYAPAEIATNTADIVMNFQGTVSITYGTAASINATITGGPPAPSGQPGAFYELIFQNVPSATNFTYGYASGAAYTVPSQGSVILYARANTNGTWNVFTTYANAQTGSLAGAIFNNATGSNTFVATCGCTYRLLSVAN